MYDEKLIQDFYEKNPPLDAIDWWIQYGSYCRYHKIDKLDHTYEDYTDTMEKIYRMYLYENKLFSEDEKGKTIIINADDFIRIRKERIAAIKKEQQNQED